MYAADGLSIAVDSSARVYTGNQDTSDGGVLVDYDPGQSCPNDSLSFVLPTRANPKVAVDEQLRYYRQSRVSFCLHFQRNAGLKVQVAR